MNREETIKVLDDLRNKLASMRNEITLLEEKEMKLEEQLLLGSTFNLNELYSLLMILISNKENKYYVLKEYKYLDILHVIQRHYYLIDSSKSDTKIESHTQMMKMAANNDIIYLAREEDSQHLEKNGSKNITFRFLLDKIRYNFKNTNYLHENGISVSSEEFEGHEYIKDFIYYLANAQTGKTNEELKLFNPINVLFDFLELEKSKENTTDLLVEVQPDGTLKTIQSIDHSKTRVKK